MTLKAVPERCEVCDKGGELKELRGVWAHYPRCFPAHWTQGPRGRNRKWEVGYKTAPKP